MHVGILHFLKKRLLEKPPTSSQARPQFSAALLKKEGDKEGRKALFGFHSFFRSLAIS